MHHLPCGTGNPINDCWQRGPSWEQNLHRLADCAIGFGKAALGGMHGKLYVVTDPGDDDLVTPKPGTHRHAVIQDEPLWIIFERDRVIKLKEELIMNSFKTIDGKGTSEHIAGGPCMYTCLYFHVVNNDYARWGMYAIRGSAAPTIFSQGNRFAASDYRFTKEVTKYENAPKSEWKNWNWRSEGDLMLYGAFFIQAGASRLSSYAKASSLIATPS
ncbi:hypothetical protein ACH5RR_007080 [Cinchona calisaya]|uniref:Pectate lyase n=1 Tax=Cinchona calisaya TaxID=153742 RepID=A0ABD3AQW7_9GENT